MAKGSPANLTGNARLDVLIGEWRATGRLAFVYPKRRKVSLNGGAANDYSVTLAYLKEWKCKHPTGEVLVIDANTDARFTGPSCRVMGRIAGDSTITNPRIIRALYDAPSSAKFGEASYTVSESDYREALRA